MANSPLPVDGGLPGRPILEFVACGAVVRKTAYLEVGGFSEFLFFIGEERLLAIDMAQAGWGLSYLDEVVAHHDPHPRGDDHQRRRRATRNDLLSIWMRRRPRSALRASARILAGQPWGGLILAALLGYVANGPLSDARVGGDGPYAVEYSRYSRHRAPDALRILLGADVALSMLAVRSIGPDEILERAREPRGIERFDQIEYAILERGSVTVVPKEGALTFPTARQ